MASKDNKSLKKNKNKNTLRELAKGVDLSPPPLLAVEVSSSLVPAVINKKQLFSVISLLRKLIFEELGFLVPAIHFTVNEELPSDWYQIKIKGAVVTQSELKKAVFVIAPEKVLENFNGIRSSEPAFGLMGKWVEELGQEELSEGPQVNIFSPLELFLLNLTEIIKSRGADFLNRQVVYFLINNLKKTYPALVDEIYPEIFSLGDITQVLKNLLREKVPIRDLATILEEMSYNAANTKDPEILTAYVRQTMDHLISQQYKDENNIINVILLDPELEKKLTDRLQKTEYGILFDFDQPMIKDILFSLEEEVKKPVYQEEHPILLCAPAIRSALKRLTERAFTQLVVLSYNEIAPGVKVNCLGVISLKKDKPSERERKLTPLDFSFDRVSAFSKMIKEMEIKGLRSQLLLECENRISELAKMLRVYALDNDGFYPDSIDVLETTSEDIPLDPASGFEFDYKTTGTSFILKSPFPNRYGLKELSYTPEEGFYKKSSEN